MSNDPLKQLHRLSRNLGDPLLDYVILGEGNTSARADQDTFWVKGSGVELRTIEPTGFVRVRFDRVLAMLDGPDLSDAQVKQALAEAKVDPAVKAHPSVETVLHAVCLQLEGVNFVGHTHPTAVNAVTCSAAFATALSGRLFPDEIVLCGPAPVLVPYTDPGLPLAREVQRRIRAFVETQGELPRVIYLQNHGVFVLGSSRQQVEHITAMVVKTARVLLGTYALGGPHFMTDEAVARIHTRPDEHYRQAIIGSQR
jgi:rhamnose utilization protein RhaD (predicted bifunctional aldolase and dehydrogenase)